MLFNGVGEQFGLLSGGCLEADIQQHARRVMHSGTAVKLCYDGNDEDDIFFQLGIGCGGTVYVMLLPISKDNHYLQLKEVYAALQQRNSGTYQLAIPDGQSTQAARYLESDAYLDAATELFNDVGVEWLSVAVNSDPHILVVGGGADARPLVSLARELGWEVTLWDSRPANARREYFLAANTILDCPVEQLEHYATQKRVNAAIIMTHNIALDAAALRAVSKPALNYLGLLGPVARKKRVLEAAKLDDSSFKTRLVGPAGYDVGGELPESIALSILAQCHAHINGIDANSVSSKMYLGGG